MPPQDFYCKSKCLTLPQGPETLKSVTAINAPLHFYQIRTFIVAVFAIIASYNYTLGTKSPKTNTTGNVNKV